MRVDLDGDPAVISTAAKVGKDTLWVVGALHRFWSWADQQTRDGNARGVTLSWLDAHVGSSGFAQALCDSGWLVVDSSGMTIPKFDKHNGFSGKKRALGQKRVKRFRNANGNAPSVTRSSLLSSDDSGLSSVLEEEFEEKPTGDQPRYRPLLWNQVQKIYDAYPPHRRGGAKGHFARFVSPAWMALVDAGEPDPGGKLLGIVKRYAASWLATTDKGKACLGPERFFGEGVWEQDASDWAEPREVKTERKLSDRIRS